MRQSRQWSFRCVACCHPGASDVIPTYVQGGAPSEATQHHCSCVSVLKRWQTASQYWEPERESAQGRFLDGRQESTHMHNCRWQSQSKTVLWLASMSCAMFQTPYKPIQDSPVAAGLALGAYFPTWHIVGARPDLSCLPVRLKLHSLAFSYLVPRRYLLVPCTCCAQSFLKSGS